MQKQEPSPTETDLHRFEHFLNTIRDKDLEPLGQETFDSIWSKSPHHNEYSQGTLQWRNYDTFFT